MTRGTDYIGVTVAFICHDGQGKVLLQKRSQRARDEQGTWDNGGGALEFGEDFEDAVRREVMEEFGAEVQTLVPLSIYNLLRDYDGVTTHWIAIPYAVQVDPSLVKIGEPHKVDEIAVYDRSSADSATFGPTNNDQDGGGCGDPLPIWVIKKGDLSRHLRRTRWV